MIEQQIRGYHSSCEQEEVDKKLILEFLDRNPDATLRSNLCAHVTSSAFVVNQEMTKVLFVFHNIYQSWSWVGGHNDGQNNLLQVAIEEAIEETGVKRITPVQDDIFTLDVIYVHNHIKKGKYVPDHLHLNAAFLLMAKEEEELVIKPDENSGVRWFFIDEVHQFVSEERMLVVYEKAFSKIRLLKTKLELTKT
jgi:ADP-ribose pyrophosphatase YjhB (NUDIX family)